LEFVAQGEATGFKLSFDIYECSITAYSLTLAIGPDFSFEPQGVTRFNITYRKRVYPVIFAGGVFDFPSYNLRGISFMRDKKEEEKSKEAV
jgi:hypothetical protein